MPVDYTLTAFWGPDGKPLTSVMPVSREEHDAQKFFAELNKQFSVPLRLDSFTFAKALEETVVVAASRSQIRECIHLERYERQYANRRLLAPRKQRRMEKRLRLMRERLLGGRAQTPSLLIQELSEEIQHKMAMATRIPEYMLIGDVSLSGTVSSCQK